MATHEPILTPNSGAVSQDSTPTPIAGRARTEGAQEHAGEHSVERLPGLALRFELRAPPSTNALYATAVAKDGVTHRYLTSRARDWKTEAATMVKIQLRLHYLHGAIPPMPETMAIRVTLHWKPSKRRRDIDNVKALLDALAEGLGVDDSRFRRLAIERVDLAPGDIEHAVVGVASAEGETW